MQLYWLSGSATASKETKAFLALTEADSESAAVSRCIKALGAGWTGFEIESIRTIDPARLREARPELREAIGIAQDTGIFVSVCEQPRSN